MLAIAMMMALVKGWRKRQPQWQTVVIASAAPLVLFALVAIFSRVSPHWTGPGLVLAAVPLVMIRFRWRRALIISGMVLGLCLSAVVVAAARSPEMLLGLSWSYQGRPHRISTGKLAAAIGNDEILAAVSAARRDEELVASESYTLAHLLAFKSGGRLPVRLAHVKPGKHGLASLYWYSPGELRGSDVLFVTEKKQVDEQLRLRFARVSEERPIEVVRNGRVVRTVRLLRCRNLLRPEGAFTRLDDDTTQ
jgi:hypothetical protein